MKRVRELFRKFQTADGRIKAVTASGVLVLAAAIALAIGVFPAMAEHVDPVPVDWGGGAGACVDNAVSLVDGTARGPSAAMYKIHVNNPKPGKTTLTGTDPYQTKITIDVGPKGDVVDFVVDTDGMVVYDFFANGGKKTNHYDYDAIGTGAKNDSGLVAPVKENPKYEGETYSLSHLNICYDLQPTDFVCGTESSPVVLSQQEGLFVKVRATTLPNSLFDCDTKRGFFFVDNANQTEGPNTLLDLGSGGETLAGQAIVTRQFSDGASIATLQYALALDDDPADLSYCGVRTKFTADSEGYVNDDETPVDGDEFDTWLEDDEYPSLQGVTDGLELPGGAIACRVADERYANGRNVTIVYFEFEDPHFF